MPSEPVSAKATLSQKVSPNSVTSCSAVTWTNLSGPPESRTVPVICLASSSSASATTAAPPSTTVTSSPDSTSGWSSKYSSTYPVAENPSR